MYNVGRNNFSDDIFFTDVYRTNRAFQRHDDSNARQILNSESQINDSNLMSGINLATATTNTSNNNNSYINNTSIISSGDKNDSQSDRYFNRSSRTATSQGKNLYKFAFESKSLSELRELTVGGNSADGMSQLSLNSAMKLNENGQLSKKLALSSVHLNNLTSDELLKNSSKKARKPKKKSIFNAQEIKDILPPESIKTPRSMAFLLFGVGIILFSIIAFSVPFERESLLTLFYCLSEVSDIGSVLSCKYETNWLTILIIGLICFTGGLILFIIELIIRKKKTIPRWISRPAIRGLMWFFFAGFMISVMDIVITSVAAINLARGVNSLYETTLLSYRKALDFGMLAGGVIVLIGYVLNYFMYFQNVIFTVIQTFFFPYFVTSISIIAIKNLATALSPNFFQNSLTAKEKSDFLGTGINLGWFMGFISGLNCFISFGLCLLFNKIR